MPAATTHAEFAAKVYSLLKEDIRKRITSLPMYYLGSQGPDILFFSRYMFLPGSLGDYGSLMHKKKIRETIHFLDKNAVTPSLRSYYYGFLTHYALDSTCHGLINAFSKMEHETTGIPESEAHFRMEGELDVWTMNQLGKTIRDYRVHDMLRISDQEARDLALLYHDLFEKVYGLNIDTKRFRQASIDCIRITAFLSPGYFKYKLAGFIESIARMPHLITGMMWNDKEGAVPDLLNFDHGTWNWYGENSQSYPELFDRALNLALKLSEKADDRLIKKTFTSEPLGETIL